MRYALETAVLWAMGRFLTVLPKEAALTIGRSFGRAVYHLVSGRRKLALGNLRSSLGGEMTDEEIRKTALASFESLGMSLASHVGFCEFVVAHF